MQGKIFDFLPQNTLFFLEKPGFFVFKTDVLVFKKQNVDYKYQFAKLGSK